MSDYIVLVVVSIGISMCLSGVIFGIFFFYIEADFKFLNEHIKSIYIRINRLDDELNILRARLYDLDTKLKEMETTDDGK